jgi:outer membrane protein assembly factor BamB
MLRSSCVAALTLAAALSPLHALAADAAMFRGEPAHRGVYASTRTPALAAMAWKFRTGGKVFSSPAVYEGSVYVGSNDGRLYALDAATGALRWKFQTRGPVNSSPAVAGKLAYSGSVDGNFYAVDTANGTAAWTFKTGGERRYAAPGIHGLVPRSETMPDPYDVFLSSPAIAGGVVYFGSGDHNVYALDAMTGALKWKFATGNVVHASPAVADGVVYIGSWDRYLYALDAATGALKWKFETGDDTDIYNQVGIASSAAVADGTVYFGCRDGHFYAVDALTGRARWKHDNRKGWVIASAAVSGGVVYFPTSDGTRLKALDARSGEAKFDVANKAVSFSSPAIAGETLYFGSSDGFVHAVDARTGATKARFQTEGSRENAAKYLDAEGRINYPAIYTEGTLDGAFVGLDRMYALGSVLSSPVVADGIVYFGSTDGHLYALN